MNKYDCLPGKNSGPTWHTNKRSSVKSGQTLVDLDKQKTFRLCPDPRIRLCSVTGAELHGVGWWSLEALQVEFEVSLPWRQGRFTQLKLISPVRALRIDLLQSYFLCKQTNLVHFSVTHWLLRQFNEGRMKTSLMSVWQETPDYKALEMKGRAQTLYLRVRDSSLGEHNTPVLPAGQGDLRGVTGGLKPLSVRQLPDTGKTRPAAV